MILAKSLTRTKLVQAAFSPSASSAWARTDRCVSLVRKVKTPALAQLTVARRMRKQRGTPVFTTTNLKDAK
jgi:hypothetical protein